MRACEAVGPRFHVSHHYPSPRDGVHSTNKLPPTFKWTLTAPSEYNSVMTLPAHEFIRCFPMHVPPAGFHRIRHYGFLTCQTRDRNIARIRELLSVRSFRSMPSRRPVLSPSAKSTRAPLPMLRQQYAHQRDLLAQPGCSI
jgi:hypothetical protein